MASPEVRIYSVIRNVAITSRTKTSAQTLSSPPPNCLHKRPRVISSCTPDELYKNGQTHIPNDSNASRKIILSRSSEAFSIQPAVMASPARFNPLLLFLLLTLVRPLAADLMTSTERGKEINLIVSRSAAFGVPKSSLTCIKRHLRSQLPLAGTNPPRYDRKAFDKLSADALVDCLQTLPPGPQRAHPSDNLSDSPAVNRRSAYLQGRVMRSVRNAMFKKLKKCRAPRGGNTAKGIQRHRQCIRRLGLNVWHVCHCYSGCHFCCIQRGLGGFSRCFYYMCRGVAWCF